MQQIIASQANVEVIINENFNALSHVAVYAVNQELTTGLTWAYYGGRWGGNLINAGTILLTANISNYLVVQRTTGTITNSTSITNWNNTKDYARVYKIVTGNTSITSIEDHRVGPSGVHGFLTLLSQLADVNITSVAENYVLLHNGTTWSSQELKLNTLTDVTITATPQNNQVLKYSGTQWIPGNNAFDDLSDVNTTGVQSGNSIIYNGTNWVPGVPASTINSLTDVSDTAAQAGDVLIYNGTQWIKVPSSIDFLSDVETTGQYAPAAGQALLWDAVALKWRPGTVSTGGALGDIDGGGAATASFSAIVDGGTSSTTTFTSTADGGASV